MKLRKVSNLRKAFANHSSADIKNTIIKVDTIRRISWWITGSITKNRITSNKKM